MASYGEQSLTLSLGSIRTYGVRLMDCLFSSARTCPPLKDHSCVWRGSGPVELFDLPVPETFDEMIVDHPNGLHKGIADS